jgi:hypothetical protein
MIRYGLVCDREHEFEAWFPSSDGYDQQAAAGFVECPTCGSQKIQKQIMAPAVSGSTREKNKPDAPPKDFHEFAAKVRSHIKKTHVYVGDKFAAEARAMHDGTKNEAPIYGEATPAEAEALRDDGVPVAPLPPPFAPIPPKKAN